MRLICLFVFVSAALADSKTEADLRQRLAASEAARMAAEKDRADLSASLAKLTAVQAQQSAVATRRNTAAEIQRGNQQAAQGITAADAQRAAERANVNAVLQREDARQQTNELLRASDSAKWGTYATLGVTAFGFLTLIFTSFWNAHIAKRDHSWSMEKIAEVKDSADAAYKEANHVNLKLETIGVKMADDKPLAP